MKRYMSKPLVFGLSLAWCAAVLAGDGGEITALKAKLAERLPEVPLDELRPSRAVPGWYELAHGMQLLYISADGKHLFVGDVVDLERRTNLTRAWRERAALRAIEAVSEENMIVIGPANARRTITVFTDVDCPYCAKLHREVPELVAAGVKVRYLLYPRAGLDSATFERSVAVWCAADRARAVDVAKSGGALDMKTCPNPVARHYELGRALQIRGTPTIYLDNGKVLTGYVPSARLLAILDLKPGAKTSMPADAR